MQDMGIMIKLWSLGEYAE